MSATIIDPFGDWIVETDDIIAYEEHDIELPFGESARTYTIVATIPEGRADPGDRIEIIAEEDFDTAHVISGVVFETIRYDETTDAITVVCDIDPTVQEFVEEAFEVEE